MAREHGLREAAPERAGASRDQDGTVGKEVFGHGSPDRCLQARAKAGNDRRCHEKPVRAAESARYGWAGIVLRANLLTRRSDASVGVQQGDQELVELGADLGEGLGGVGERDTTIALSQSAPKRRCAKGRVGRSRTQPSAMAWRSPSSINARP